MQNLEALLRRGQVLHQSGELKQAKEVYLRVLAKRPKHFDALHLLGVIAAQTGDPEQAAELIGRAIKQNPGHAAAHYNLGNSLKKLSRIREALICYDNALSIAPNLAEAQNAKAGALKGLGRIEEALFCYENAIGTKPAYAEAWMNRGVLLNEVGRSDEAVKSYGCAVALRPDYFEAYNNRGLALEELGRNDEALQDYEQAISINQEFADACNNRGRILVKANRLAEALACFDKAVLVRFDFVDAIFNQGVVLQTVGRLDEAVVCYERVVALDPGHVNALGNWGGVLFEKRCFSDALMLYSKVITIRPEDARALYNRGVVLLELMRIEEALNCFNQALVFDPDYEFLFGLKLHTQMRICDWYELRSQLISIESALLAGRPVTAPFPVLGLLDSPELQLLSSRTFVDLKSTTVNPDGVILVNDSDDKIRVGYYSSDFYSHATSYLMIELFEGHDSERFEIYGFSIGPVVSDDIQQRVSSAFHQFIDVSKKSDLEIVHLSRDLRIEIAVDLKGFTKGSRLGIFAHRCAPVQVNYLGYPGTMGASFIDYIIADDVLIPPASRQYYDEKVVYLPCSYQPNDSNRMISNRLFTRSEIGLPETGFVFCCFNSNYKILPEMFDVWMRLLSKVGGSVLWLLEDNPLAVDNLRKEATARGVAPDRLVFAKRISLDEHLARHRLADLFLDTFPCNAHTTMSDALWAGLPALTLCGRSFASRVGASLVGALGLSELVVETFEDYESKAVELSANPELLSRIKSRLGSERTTSMLFNGRFLAKHLEFAFKMMSDRYRSGNAPDHLFVRSPQGPIEV
jgi:predicted O-linked N-acetylglucosamine transferase (SPINDLY family)